MSFLSDSVPRKVNFFLRQSIAALESCNRSSEDPDAVYSAEEFYSDLDERRLRAKILIFHDVS